MTDKETKQVEEIFQNFIKEYPNGFEIYADFKISQELFADGVSRFWKSLEKHSGSSLEGEITQAVFPENEGFYYMDEVADQVEAALFEDLDEDQKELLETFRDENQTNLLSELLDRGLNVLDSFKDIGAFDRNYDINICFATFNERNLDLTIASSTIRNVYDGYITPLDKDALYSNDLTEKELCERFDNALTYIVYQQGYTMKDLFEAIYINKSDSIFLESLANAYSEHSYASSQIAAALSLSADKFEEFQKILTAEAANDTTFNTCYYKPGVTDINTLISEAKEVLVIEPKNDIYILDRQNGSGCTVSIELEKPLQIPLSMIEMVQVEKGRSCGYTIDRISEACRRTDEFKIEQCKNLEKSIAIESPREMADSLIKCYDNEKKYEQTFEKKDRGD